MNATASAIADGPTVAWLTHSLAEEPEVLDFFDLAALVEAVVMHDVLELVFPKGTEHPFDFDLINATKEHLDPSVKEGIVRFRGYTAPELPIKPAHTPATAKPRHRAKHIEATADFTAWYLLQNVMFVLAERASAKSTVVLPRQSALYKMNRQVQAEHSICNLYRNYGSVSELAKMARIASGNTTSIEFHHLPMPPIALDVMKRSSSMNRMVSRG